MVISFSPSCTCSRLVRARFPSARFFPADPLLFYPLADPSRKCALRSLRDCFEKLLAPFSRVLSVGLSLGSLALRSFRLSPAFFTTTASADFCAALTSQSSPSKVFNVSTRIAGLYLLPLSVTVGFRWLLAHSSPASGLSARSSSCDRVFANASFSSVPRGSVPCLSLRLFVTASGQFLSFDYIEPMSGTLAWHEVPGTAPPEKDRPVGDGVIRQVCAPLG